MCCSFCVLLLFAGVVCTKCARVCLCCVYTFVLLPSSHTRTGRTRSGIDGVYWVSVVWMTEKMIEARHGVLDTFFQSSTPLKPINPPGPFSDVHLPLPLNFMTGSWRSGPARSDGCTVHRWLGGGRGSQLPNTKFNGNGKCTFFAQACAFWAV